MKNEKKNVVKTIEILEGESVLDALQQEMMAEAAKMIEEGNYTLAEDKYSTDDVCVKFNGASLVKGTLSKQGWVQVAAIDTLEFGEEKKAELKAERTKASNEFLLAKLEAQIAELKKQ